MSKDEMSSFVSDSFLYDIFDHLGIISNWLCYESSVVDSTVKVVILDRQNQKMYHIIPGFTDNEPFITIERNNVDYETFLKAFDEDLTDGFFILVAPDVIKAKYGCDVI